MKIVAYLDKIDISGHNFRIQVTLRWWAQNSCETTTTAPSTTDNPTTTETTPTPTTTTTTSQTTTRSVVDTPLDITLIPIAILLLWIYSQKKERKRRD
ncbi:MAG: hypothetical protein ACFFFG_01465 [Candidatus Thorarchaeota archaeon]